MVSAVVGFLAAALLVCCAAGQRTARPASAVEELAQWMSGTFSSAAQAREHPDDFYAVSLVVVPIWGSGPHGSDDPGSAWLYVEQALEESPDRPYRQRIYHLVEYERGVRSDVYELPGEPLEYAGAWRDPARFDELDPAVLLHRTGCSIYLTRLTPEAYRGRTRGNGCSSQLRGARHATSEVVVGRDALSSWDRGYDAEGEQVWGAEAGPYVFEKLSPDPPE